MALCCSKTEPKSHSDCGQLLNCSTSGRELSSYGLSSVMTVGHNELWQHLTAKGISCSMHLLVLDVIA